MDKKITALIIFVSVVLLLGGVFLLSKNSNNQNSSGYTLSDKFEDKNLLLGDSRNTIGSPSAKVTLVEVSDFQCPACASVHPEISSIIQQYKDQIYFVYRHFPLPQHKNAQIAAEASEAAGHQGKFWEMSDLLFNNQSDWENLQNPVEIFTSYAKTLNLDTEKFKNDLTSHKYKDLVDKDYKDGLDIGVDSTPSFYFNGKRYKGSVETLKNLIDQTLKS